MEIITHLITLVTGGGITGAIASIYSARKSAKVGQAGTEVEATAAQSADWAAFTQAIQRQVERQDTKIADLEGRMTKMRADQLLDAQYIDLLREHIYERREPPPPQRPRPRPDYGDPQVGG